jgi:hypothetical protein
MHSSPRSERALPLLLAVVAVASAPLLIAAPFDAHHVRQCATLAMAESWGSGPAPAWALAERGGLPLFEAVLGFALRLTGGLWAAPLARTISLVAWLVAAREVGLWGARRLFVPASWAAAGMLLSPLALLYGRAAQPDALAAALLAWGLARTDRGDRWDAVAGGIAVGLGGAMDAGVLGVALPTLILARSPAPRRGAAALLAGLLPGAAAVAGFPPDVPAATGGAVGVLVPVVLFTVLTPLGALLLASCAAEAPLGAAPFAAGLAGAAAWIAVFRSYAAEHHYALLLLLPCLSPLIAAGAAALLRRGAALPQAGRGALAGLALVLAAASAIEGGRFLGRSLRQDSRVPTVARAAAELVPADRLVVVADRHPQSVLYAMGRRGFPRHRVDIAEIARLEAAGADALLLTETSPSWADADLRGRLLERRRVAAYGDGFVLVKLDLGRARLDGG